MTTTTTAELAAVSEMKSAIDAMAVVTLSPEKYAAEVYQPFRAKLADAINSVRAVDYDITTTAGMAVAIKCRALFRDMRVAADKERKARKEPITKIGKLLESGFDEVEQRITPLEEMFDGDIKAEEVRKEAEKAAKIAAERARVEAIQRDIQSIRDIPAGLALKDSSAIATAIDALRQIEATDERFAEFKDVAAKVIDETDHALVQMHGATKQAELAAVAAEEARKAEVARIEAERAELAQLRAAAAETARLAKIESDRVAAEQAAEAKRLADERRQQEAELQRQRDAEAARVCAEQEALDQSAAELRAAQEQQRMAMSEISGIQQQAIIAQVGRAPYVKGGDSASYAHVLAETKAWPIDEKNFGPLTGVAQMVKSTAIAALEQGFAACIERDHAAALLLDAAFDHERELDREAERARLQTLAGQHLADAQLPPPESLTEADALIDAGGRPDITDRDIIDLICATFDVSPLEAVERLSSIDFAAARAEHEVAA